MKSQPQTGNIEVRLVDYPMFQEGFDFGVRVMLDGELVAERKLAEFVSAGETPEEAEWSTTFVVRRGSAVLLSDLSGSAAGTPAPPSFADPCRLEVTVDPGLTVVVSLDWGTGCLKKI